MHVSLICRFESHNYVFMSLFFLRIHTLLFNLGQLEPDSATIVSKFHFLTCLV